METTGKKKMVKNCRKCAWADIDRKFCRVTASIIRRTDAAETCKFYCPIKPRKDHPSGS